MIGLFRKCPHISFVVVAFNMARELPRTLMSLTREYQQKCTGIDYEVLVVDNGSTPPFGEKRVNAYGSYFRYIYLNDAPPSPAYALNYGVEHSRGKIVCSMIDGARIASPGIVYLAAAAFRAFNTPTVSVAGWHLGPDFQVRSVTEGYDQSAEDSLLKQIGFPSHGYRLFDIAVFAGSCREGWFLPMGESNAIFIRKDAYIELGGYDERFDLPGGGLLNPDFFRRAVLRETGENIMLLGEGTFHQVHGGVATNKSEIDLQVSLAKWNDQYLAIRGEKFESPQKPFMYFGGVPRSTLSSLELSATNAVRSASHRP